MSKDKEWHGDENLQFSTEIYIDNLFRVRVPARRTQDGTIIWNYFGVPAAVMVVLVNAYNSHVEQQRDTSRISTGDGET